ncbi:MAG TPA: Maf family protein [Acetobacteraceae bacterium]|jgi:septum formation protein|nr:Maf family protein [Acetobacteraceae bacterium]
MLQVPMLQAGAPALVLASGSAARRALLEAAGLRFAVQPVAIDEAALRETVQAEGGGAEEAALLLAGMKAARGSAGAGDGLVIGADQILACDGAWFGKPADRYAAADQLRALRGRTHSLATAVACWRGGAEVWRHVASPRLSMRRFSDAFLDAYLAAEGAAVLGSVGCYRIEGLGVHLFDAVEGEHAAILGLPMLALLGFLRQHGVVVA